MSLIRNLSTYVLNIIFWIFVFECLWEKCNTAITYKIFRQTGGLQLSYSYLSIAERSKIQCLSQCAEEELCFIVSYDLINETCRLSDKWINDYGISAIEDTFSVVYFDTDRFETIIVMTPNAYDYRIIEDDGILLHGEHFLLFEVKACHDVHVLLMQDRNDLDTNILEIVIGGWGNTISGIRHVRQGNLITQADHVPLECDIFRPFWVSWFNESVHVGTGVSIGQDKFMSVVNSGGIAINFVSISTGFGASGMWSFNRLKT